MKLASQLKKLLKKKDLTVAQLARATGVSSKTIYSWINTNQNPQRLDDLKKVANELEVSLDYILFDETKFERKTSIADFKEEINLGLLEIILRKPKN